MKNTCFQGLLIKIVIKNNFEGPTKIGFEKALLK